MNNNDKILKFLARISVLIGGISLIVLGASIMWMIVRADTAPSNVRFLVVAIGLAFNIFGVFMILIYSRVVKIYVHLD